MNTLPSCSKLSGKSAFVKVTQELETLGKMKLQQAQTPVTLQR